MAAAEPGIFAPLPGWGLNTVRLLFTWEAYEPSPGEYDDAYLEAIAGAAKAAREAGLYVIIDFHQDGFSRFSIDGCGDGAPSWALPASVPPKTPDNGPACASWGIKMQSDKDMLASWDAFHADEAGVKTRYLAMIESVSARFAAQPGVIGYDLMNEPWGDEVTELGPFHEQAAAAVRKASPDAIIFVSPHARTSAGVPTQLEKPTFGNAVYSPHFYDASVILFKSWSGVEPDMAFLTMQSTADDWGVPLFVGELGAPALTAEGPAYIDSLYRHLDAGSLSAAHWVYTPGWTEATKDGWNEEDLSIVGAEGELRDNFRARPAWQKIAGDPALFRVNDAEAPAARSIELEWESAPGIGNTELFVPKEAFFGADALSADSLSVEVEGDGLSCEAGGDKVVCSTSKPGHMRVVVKKGEASEATGEPGGCSLAGAGQGGGGPMMMACLALAHALRRRRARSRT
ncbi:MAG: cellulase family glycosylhydrolase [Polyangiaceae bacterium]